MNPAQNTKFLNIAPPEAAYDNETITVAEIDTLGWDYCQILVILGDADIAQSALAVTEADVSATSHANVTGLVFATSDTIAGSTSALPLSTDGDDMFLFEIDLKGRMRYLDVTCTVGDGTANYVSMIAILSRGASAPLTAAQRGCNQILRV